MDRAIYETFICIKIHVAQKLYDKCPLKGKEGFNLRIPNQLLPKYTRGQFVQYHLVIFSVTVLGDYSEFRVKNQPVKIDILSSYAEAIIEKQLSIIMSSLYFYGLYFRAVRSVC